MSAVFKVNALAFKNLAKRLSDPSIKRAVYDIMKEKPVAALISQAIADNFDVEGPGWPPLKIRQGKPLQKSGLLKKSVTTPGAKGNIYRVQGTTITWGTNLVYAGIHQNGGEVVAKNSKFLFIPISKKGEKVGPIKDKSARKGSGLKVGRDMIFKKSVMVPARPFLNIRKVWMARIFGYVLQRANNIILQRIMR
jgi:phage gpG-like protein